MRCICLPIAHTPDYTERERAVNSQNHKGTNQVAREYTKMNNKIQKYRHTKPHIKYK